MRAAPGPSARPGGPSSPSRRRPSTACGSCLSPARRALACRSSASPGPFPRGCLRRIPLLGANFLSGRQARADQSCLCSSLGQHDLNLIYERGQGAGARLLARAWEEEVGALAETAADHHVLGLKGVDGAAEADAQVRAEPFQQLEGVLVVVVAGGCHHVAAADPVLLALLQQLADARVGVVLGELRRVALERHAAAEGLEAAAVRARAGAVGAVPVDHLV